MKWEIRKGKITLEAVLRNRILQILIIAVSLFLFLACSPGPLKNSRTIERFLNRNKYPYSLDSEGDFKLTITLEDQTENTVWIRKELNYSGKEAVREIFSVGAVLEEDQSEYLSSYLLQDNFQTRVMGSWAYIKNEKDRKVLLIYLLKLPLSTGEYYLKDALRETAFAAGVMESVVNQND